MDIHIGSNRRGSLASPIITRNLQQDDKGHTIVVEGVADSFRLQNATIYQEISLKEIQNLKKNPKIEIEKLKTKYARDNQER